MTEKSVPQTFLLLECIPCLRFPVPGHPGDPFVSPGLQLPVSEFHSSRQQPVFLSSVSIITVGKLTTRCNVATSCWLRHVKTKSCTQLTTLFQNKQKFIDHSTDGKRSTRCMVFGFYLGKHLPMRLPETSSMWAKLEDLISKQSSDNQYDNQ